MKFYPDFLASIFFSINSECIASSSFMILYPFHIFQLKLLLLIIKMYFKESREDSEIPAEKQEQFRQEGRLELEDRMTQLEQMHQVRIGEITQQMTTASEENDSYKKEIENLKQTSLEKEERFKTLFKNAKDRIMTLTEQNTSLKAELSNQERQGKRICVKKCIIIYEE